MEYLTRSVPLPPGGKDLVDFFRTDAYLQLPIGTRNRVTLAKDVTPDLLAKWREEAERMGAALPEDDGNSDKVLELSVTTPFLVFDIHNVAKIGVKLLPNPQGKGSGNQIVCPEFQFTLLEEKFWADGPPPLVWIFNQLTGIDRPGRSTASGGGGGGGDDEREGRYGHPNHALYRVRAVVSDDGTRLAFGSRMETELNIRFPAELLRIIPVDKRIIEERGSRSLRESMERDVPPGVDAFRESYLEWLRT